MSQQNCWEFKKCGREENGSKAAELGVCAAFTENRTDGVHRGKNGGRTCWAITGTLCKGAKQGDEEAKRKDCMHCEFYLSVRKEEIKDFMMAGQILAMLK